MVPVHNPVNKPTTQCTYHHIQCTLQHTATLCSLQPNIQCTSSAHTTAAITSLVHILQQPLHLQCTYYSSHYIFSAHTTAAITSSVHILQQPLHLQCTYYSSHYIFSAHTTAAITSSVHTASMYSHVQLSAANLQCTLQPTAVIYNHLHYSYTIQCTLQLHYLMPIPYSASSEEG